MSTLIIRKRSLKTWVHTDSILGDFIISKFYFNADGVNFQIVEQGQSRRVIYAVTDITLYDTINGGSAETFSTITALSLRLEQLNYPAFQYDGDITNIANLIESGTGVTITGDGTEASPYVISSTGGGGGSQTLAQTLDLGNTTGGENISISNGDAILLDNGSMLKKGTIDAGNGGAKGIAQICAVGYEHKWEAGRLYTMNDGGTTIREVSHNFTYTPTVNDDVTKGFVENTRWILDNGDVYLCTEPTEGAAVWELVNTGTIPTLQQVLDNNHDLVDGNNFQGTDAGLLNQGSNVNSLGTFSMFLNEGNNVNAFGYSSGRYGDPIMPNIFNNVNLFGEFANADEDGQTVLSKDGTIMARISTTDLTETRKYNLPDADGTIALISDIPSYTTPTLQDVTDEGNETTIPIIVKQTENETTITLTSASLNFEDIVNEGTTNLVFESSSIPNQQVLIKNETGTIALLSDITTPTLQQVTDEGNTTTNDVKVNSLGLYSNPQADYGYLSWDGDNGLVLKDDLTQILFRADKGGSSLSFVNSDDFTAKLDATILTENKTFLLPDADGTIALTADIPTNTSQLTNDGADGVNPYITALDIPTTSQASTLVREVKNMTGATLTKGTVVYISGANGNKPLVSKAIATTDALSARTFGLLQSNISNNGTGNCVIIGDLSGLDTSSFTEGDQLYLSGVTAGTYTSTRTLAPTHLVYIGKITRSHPTLGQIEVGIQNGYELAEIHDVALSSEANNQALIYESSTDLWKNKTIIEDSITNGVTTIAPSQNAVFDALALKQAALSYTPYKFIQTGITAHTGTVAETIIATATIAGGSFNASDVMKVMFGANKSSTATACTQRIKINTSNTLTGAVTLAGLNSTTANAVILKRNFVLNNGNLYGMQFSSTNTVTDEAVVLTSTYNNTPFNTANTLYLFFTVQLGNVADSVIPNLFNITN